MSTLTEYSDATRRLLQNPPAPTSLYSTANITEYVNIARRQLAGDSECIRYMGSLAISSGNRVYPFASINVGTASVTGIAGVFNVRMVAYALGDGQQKVYTRAWEWFEDYHLNTPVPASGAPKTYAQYGQASTGSLYLDPIPDGDYTLNLDCTCYPVDLVDDTTVDAIPFPFNEAVPYFAAYMALLSTQAGFREDQADRMLQRYEEFKNRGRRYSNPSVLPYVYAQSPDPTLPAKLGQTGG